MTADMWTGSDAYEAYVGRWSRRVATVFLRWLGRPAGERWVDVGCGTGALTSAVLAHADPGPVVGVDPSAGYLAAAHRGTADPRAAFVRADARALPFADAAVDVVVSGLALNFVPDQPRAVAEFVRIVRPGGVVAAYVWDYAEGMAMMREFWDAAVVLEPSAVSRVESLRFPGCRPDPLRDLWAGAGLGDVGVEAIEVPTVFTDFDDFWRPFLGGQGPAPGYVASLPPSRRDTLRELLRHRLPAAADGSVPLTARAWAVRGTR